LRAARTFRGPQWRWRIGKNARADFVIEPIQESYRLLYAFLVKIRLGFISDLLMSIFLLPTLYVWMAGDNDVLPEADRSEDV
jgi:hypothetical protein